MDLCRQNDLCFSICCLGLSWTSPVTQTVKNLPAMQETRVWSLSWEDRLEKEIATLSSIIAWRIPCAEKPGGLQSMGSQRVGHDSATNTRSLYVSFQGTPWFRDLPSQIPMWYCFLQHWTLLSLPDTSTNKHHFCLGPSASFFMKLLVIALCSSPVAYWTPFNLGGSSSSVISFCFFILFLGFSRQEYWSGLPLPPPVDHILSELSTLTSPSWVACMAWIIASLSYASPFAMTRLWSIKGN